MRDYLKKTVTKALVLSGVDRAFRWMNRDRLLVVMYHGVTKEQYHPPVWTQLPVDVFCDQLAFLHRHYRIVSLEQVVHALHGGAPLPERSALLTFDDGLRNNFSVVYPILQQVGVPAAIFLTVDLIGSDGMLWFDELYLLIREGGREGIPIELPWPEARRHYCAGNLWETYTICVEQAKRGGARMRRELLAGLRERVPLDRERYLPDFGLLGWDEVREMDRSGLVGFGVHTATHRILTELEEHELAEEVLAPRKRFRKELGREAESFCFPNGRPGLDFAPTHQEYLRSNGYLCAFSTREGLFDRAVGDRMAIARISAGNDGSSYPDYFRLNASGALHPLRGIKRRWDKMEGACWHQGWR